MRGLIYRKLLRLGAAYTQSVPTAEVVQLAGEGTEQLETYFGAYLPQLFYSMLATVTLFAEALYGFCCFRRFGKEPCLMKKIPPLLPKTRAENSTPPRSPKPATLATGKNRAAKDNL